MKDKNQAAIRKFIEDQIDLCEKIESKLQVIIIKKLKYENEVIDINAPMYFVIVIYEMKQKIISKLKNCEIDHDKTVVDIIYDEKLEDVKFVNEMTISYNNMLSTKLNNQDNNTHKSLVSSKKH